MSSQASGNGNNRQNKTSLKSTNLDKVPSSSPLREYLASDQGRVVRLAADDTAGGGKTTLHDLNDFMQQNTDKRIVDNAKNSMAGGTSNTHWGRK